MTLELEPGNSICIFFVVVVVFIFIWFYYSFYFIFFLDGSFIQWGLCVMVYLPFVIADDADHASVPPIALSCSYCTCFSQVLVLLDAGCHWWRSCHWLRVEQDKILSNTVTFWSSKTLLSQVFRHWGEKKTNSDIYERIVNLFKLSNKILIFVSCVWYVMPCFFPLT